MEDFHPEDEPLRDARRRGEEVGAQPIGAAGGAALRFLATRAYDWLHTPADALVTRKDPMDFARRLSFYATHGEEGFSRPPAQGTIPA